MGLHVRGPQLNPQRDPRWGRNDNSPGEDAYLEGVALALILNVILNVILNRKGQYGAYIVLGGQGADETGKYHGERRKALCEMKHFDAYRYV